MFFPANWNGTHIRPPVNFFYVNNTRKKLLKEKYLKLIRFLEIRDRDIFEVDPLQ